jgi:hypothetical protein
VRRDIGSPSKDGRRAFLRTSRETAEPQQYGQTGGHASHGTDRPQPPQSRFPVRLDRFIPRKFAHFLPPARVYSWLASVAAMLMPLSQLRKRSSETEYRIEKHLETYGRHGWVGTQGMSSKLYVTAT